MVPVAIPQVPSVPSRTPERVQLSSLLLPLLRAYPLAVLQEQPWGAQTSRNLLDKVCGVKCYFFFFLDQTDVVGKMNSLSKIFFEIYFKYFSSHIFITS